MRRTRLTLVAAAAVASVVLVGCGGSEGSPDAQTASTTTPPKIGSWTDVNGIHVPLGSTDGPTDRYTGFSRTPQGAALAAINQSVQLSTATDKQWDEVLPAVSAPGPGRDMYAANRALLSITEPVDKTVAPEILGYTITEYSDDQAKVDVVQRFPDDSLAAAHTTVVWVGEDWKLDLPTAEDGAGATELTEKPADLVDLEGTRK
ncbi:hypothetical protein [Rhodococcus sp. NPDC058481]|uniref:hypothetical protein n=1 Tax=unclassified Rhodococcus (in: high G+C Gram-positive bacteria) TaxID=192944 RepID=UPI00365AFB92